MSRTQLNKIEDYFQKGTVQSIPFAGTTFALLVHQIPCVFQLLTITHQGRMRTFFLHLIFISNIHTISRLEINTEVC